MPKRRVTWIVMADGSRARIVKPREAGSGFDVLSELDSSEARTPSRDLVSERPGHSQESAAAARHTIEPRNDPHAQVKSAFLRSVADQLNRAAGEKAFDALILFAPARCLGELREALDDKTRGKIKATAPKDLTKLPLAELPEHLEALTPP